MNNQADQIVPVNPAHPMTAGPNAPPRPNSNGVSILLVTLLVLAISNQVLA